MKKIIFLVLLLLLDASLSYSQNNPDSVDVPAAVKVIARPLPDSILLRWAPNNPITWQFANKYGYRIEKYLLVRNNQLLAGPQSVSVHTIKPYPLEQWEPLVNRPELEQEASIAAQCLYGASIQITTNQNKVMQLVNQSREQEMRYTYSLIAADHSFTVAKALGLAFTDREAKKNEKYLYKIYVDTPAGIEQADTGYVYTGVDEYKELPVPIGFQVEFTDKAALIAWDKMILAHHYNQYIVERSTDGVTFQSITKVPVSMITQSEDARYGASSQYMYMNDSLPQNNKVFYYRLKGINSFSEYSPATEVVKGQGKEISDTNVELFAPDVQPDGKVVLKWGFPEKKNDLIEGFVVEKAPKADEAYQPLHEGILKSTLRTFEEKIGDGSSYYRVRVINKEGTSKTSFPQLVQKEDSIPPSIPVSFQGQVDSLGVVRLSWQPSPEKDVYGYRIFRGNYLETEFSEITKEAVLDTVYQDTVRINTLQTAIYYRIASVDKRFNQSERSEPLLLQKPDTIAPVPPLFTQVVSSDSCVVLEWLPSSSADVKEYLLYRSPEDSEDWFLIATFKTEDSIHTYRDKEIPPLKMHQYTILAVDRNNLESPPSPPMSAKKLKNFRSAPLPEIRLEKAGGTPGLRLSWQWQTAPEIGYYVIYKAQNDEGLFMYRQVEAGSSDFTDKEVKQGNRYQYRIRVVLKDGTESAFSEAYGMVYE